MRVERVQAASFRCYARLECAPGPGLTAIVGPNGAGKTSLLEAVHFGLLAWTPRTHDDPRVLRDGDEAARVVVRTQVAGRSIESAVGYRPGEPKRISLDGAPQRSGEALARTFAVLVFTPDRLAVVKGAPALRRAYVDRASARLWPRYARLAADYGHVLAQRNALLRRARAGAASLDGLDVWDAQLAQLGAEVCAVRTRFVAGVGVPFAEHLARLGGAAEDPSLAYRPSGPTDEDGLREALLARRRRDAERAATGVGPHLDDIVFRDRGRDVRAFGSQGEQRSAVLALLLAEADLVHAERGLRPLLLLDDVASELDEDRRARLLDAVRERGQALVTTTDAALVEAQADLVLRVAAGELAPA